MAAMSEMNLVIEDLRTAANALISVADSLTQMYSTSEETEAELLQERKPLTLEEVRDILRHKCEERRGGKTMAKTVTKIPQTRNLFTTAPIATTARRKVAGYARVSTDSDEQFTSYEAQVDYYTQFIRSHADWDFVKVYTDEGISAVTTRHRDGFNEMIADALAGKIDLIVTKSVSRFARNTVDSLTTIRKLKEHGCECFFEKENIYTFDGKGELLITIMSSLAQEESRSISENVTWGHRKFLKTSPGATGRGWQTARSRWPTAPFWATIRVRTATWLSTRRKPESCASSTGNSWRAWLPSASAVCWMRWAY